MEYSVVVYLSNGQEIPFKCKAGSELEVRNRITLPNHDSWYFFENASGKGYFKKDEVVTILIK